MRVGRRWQQTVTVTCASKPTTILSLRSPKPAAVMRAVDREWRPYKLYPIEQKYLRCAALVDDINANNRESVKKMYLFSFYAFSTFILIGCVARIEAR